MIQTNIALKVLPQSRKVTKVHQAKSLRLSVPFVPESFFL